MLPELTLGSGSRSRDAMSVLHGVLRGIVRKACTRVRRHLADRSRWRRLYGMPSTIRPHLGGRYGSAARNQSLHQVFIMAANPPSTEGLRGLRRLCCWFLDLHVYWDYSHIKKRREKSRSDSVPRPMAV